MMPERRTGLADLIERLFGATIFFGVRLLTPWTWFRREELVDDDFRRVERSPLWRMYEIGEQIGVAISGFFGAIVDSVELVAINLGAFIRRLLRLGR
jgi:hypothetical protein